MQGEKRRIETVLAVLDRWVIQALLIAGLLFILAAVLGSLLVLGWQVYQYLQVGIWFPIGTAHGIAYVLDLPANSWWNRPASWIGLHAVLQFVPASLAVLVSASTFGGLLNMCAERLQASSPFIDRG